MINTYLAKKYCKEDISLIENYAEAIADEMQMWEVHHRNEILENKSAEQLIAEGRYYDRPACELIFLTKSEHKSLHHKGKQLSAEHKRKIGVKTSIALKGKPQPWKYKKVRQYTKDGEFVAEYQSLAEAARKTGISRGNISSCCNGKLKSAGGYIWKFA